MGNGIMDDAIKKLEDAFITLPPPPYMTQENVNAVMLEAFHNLVEEAEEWGNGNAEKFYHFTTGATALIYHINKVLKEQEKRRYEKAE